MKIKSIICSSLLFTLFSSPVLASVEKTVIGNNDILLEERYGIAELDPKSGPVPRAASVTDSYVSRYITSDGRNHYAEGYVTVQNSGSDYFHYTTATLEKGSTTYSTSGRIWGSGQVFAKTGYTPVSNNAIDHIYYGW